MIQRIQSLYLALVTLLSLFLFSGSYLIFTENQGSFIGLTFAGIIRFTTGQEGVVIQSAYPYTALLILIPLISLVTIFLFKNRLLQIRLVVLTAALILLLIAFSVYYYFLITNSYGAPLKPGFLMAIPVLLLVFSALAYRGIKKDDEMVRSYDRLR